MALAHEQLPTIPLRGSAGCDRVRQDERVDPYLPTRADSAGRTLVNSLPIKRRLGLPNRIKNWSLTSLQHRLMKTGGRLVKHVRYCWLLLAEGHLSRRLFGEILDRIGALLLPSG